MLKTGLFMNNRNLFIIVLEAEKSKTKPADSVSSEGCFLLLRWNLLAVSSRGTRGLSSIFYKVTNSIVLVHFTLL
jgi:hypothetical protein